MYTALRGCSFQARNGNFVFFVGVLCRADCLTLPYRDSLFDAVLFIGVIHHLVSAERQVKAIRELERVVRPGGNILIYAWAWEQQKRKVNTAGYPHQAC